MPHWEVVHIGPDTLLEASTAVHQAKDFELLWFDVFQMGQCQVRAKTHGVVPRFIAWEGWRRRRIARL